MLLFNLILAMKKRDSLEKYSKLSITEAQEKYNEVISKFSV